MMNNFKKLNNILGAIVFFIASAVYILTTEPTASFWDCGEYIATAYKLQVGHPPGAPLFQMIGRFFSLFAFGDTSHVAHMVNIMSALSSGLTILFLFWTITMLAKKLVLKTGEMTDGKMYAVLGSGLVGALAYTFTDSFWFSAEEGEVYAMSSFFTALVFWAILKWEEKAGEKHSFRWLIFIAYMMGLSIGVHLLNLLAIPAISFVYYFKKYKNPNLKGIIVTFIISVLILGLVMNGIIPWIVKLAGYSELFFVNFIGLPFNTGTVFYFIVLIGGIYWGIRYTRKQQKVVWNTVLWGLTFLLIGYSSFFMLVIRSNANTPINENSPKDAITLLAYLAREQYGDWPIFSGPYFNAPVIEYKNGKPIYRKDKKRGKYVVVDKNKNQIPVYDPRFTTIFPRMWNNTNQLYIKDYKTWSKMKGEPVKVTTNYGEENVVYKPTFTENLRFFFRYQLNHMYFRYFMWNFSGRQDDIQGMADRKHGNWITGIPFIDKARLGPMLNVPESMKNKATNKFYMLPFILGIIGLVYQLRKDNRNSLIVFLLFFMTGLAIVVYLNQHSPQPRERDYAYAASFYAFAMWIGMGTLALTGFASKYLNSKIAAFVVTGVSLILVPGIMAKEGWDDHDRSNRYTVTALASDYLNSCAPNAILFTNGDNDTFPLWYAQEVEGIRTDVRVVNLSLLNAAWYINQMRRKVYNSEPLPLSIPPEMYAGDKRNFTYIIENEKIKGYVDLRQLLDLVISSPDKFVRSTSMGNFDYFPAKKFRIPVDSATVVNNGTVSPEYAGRIVKEVTWTFNNNAIAKSFLIVLDLLATNNWERPVYFAITTGGEAYMGLEDYFMLDGLAYRLVPVKSESDRGQPGTVNTDVMYDNVMNKFRWGNMNNPDVYLDETNRRMTMNLRNNFHRLADALILEGKKDSALAVLDKCIEVVPDNCIPYDYFTIPIAEDYYKIGETEKANTIVSRLITIFDENLGYYFQFEGKRARVYDDDIQQNLYMIRKVTDVTRNNKQTELYTKATEVYNKYSKIYFKK
jgi:hypothetical protein